MAGLNCWEIMKCGRELTMVDGEARIMCPAASEYRLHGYHGGINGGRACWVVPATVCGGETQGIFANKVQACLECRFYKKVQSEEGVQFLRARQLMDKLDERGRLQEIPTLPSLQTF